MPRVVTKTKSTAGRAYSCGRCGRKIEPGERYYSYAFRYGGKYFRCIDHYPRPSELTQSKMSEVYAAQEVASDELPNADSVEAINTIVENVAEIARTVAEEYEEAAEPFGGAGENAERSEELGIWADELESFDAEESVPDPDPDDPDADPLEDAREAAREAIDGSPL